MERKNPPWEWGHLWEELSQMGENMRLGTALTGSIGKMKLHDSSVSGLEYSNNLPPLGFPSVSGVRGRKPSLERNYLPQKHVGPSVKPHDGFRNAGGTLWSLSFQLFISLLFDNVSESSSAFRVFRESFFFPDLLHILSKREIFPEGSPSLRWVWRTTFVLIARSIAESDLLPPIVLK